jgi:PP-loop superfamily ATP-utilizing enzyme
MIRVVSEPLGGRPGVGAVTEFYGDNLTLMKFRLPVSEANDKIRRRGFECHLPRMSVRLSRNELGWDDCAPTNET